MKTNRLEAFSDGVFAIIITIMVLEIKMPHSSNWLDLKPLFPVFLSYLLSFIYVGIYWGNHHHLLQSVKQVSSNMIWANLSLLFCLSLIPAATAWMGDNDFAVNPLALYGIVLLFCGFTYTILQKIVETNSHDIEALKSAFKNSNKKGIASLIGYIFAVFLAYVYPAIAEIIYFSIAIMWLVPDKQIENALKSDS